MIKSELNIITKKESQMERSSSIQTRCSGRRLQSPYVSC